ncbi:hypothetical protein MAM1_0173d07220 [Mucor ambiguus]|uniref:C2H2-type domain-containing protein n=1 Tax=Mucor ambiguus TaxID=91626 RepID=A0A0C9MW39_9FUNG|nr:hypothetical protein MAM1_0173d07220 [Mucor ambiguus]
MSSMLSFQIRQQAQQQQQQAKTSNPGGLPSPPNSFCGEETTISASTATVHEKPAFLAQTRRDSLQTVFNDMHIKDYSTSLPENYTIDHSSSSVPRKHLAATMAGTATATAAATGGLTIRNNNRRPSDIMVSNSSGNFGMGGGGRRKSSASRGLSESFSGQYRCTDCGKSYKHPNCLQKHRWEHSEEWELTKKLPLTKHQQVQMLEAAAILIGMDRIRSDVKKEEEQQQKAEEEQEEEDDIVVEEEEEIDLDDIDEDDRKETTAADDDNDEDDESIIIDDDDSIFMEDL